MKKNPQNNKTKPKPNTTIYMENVFVLWLLKVYKYSQYDQV